MARLRLPCVLLLSSFAGALSAHVSTTTTSDEWFAVDSLCSAPREPQISQDGCLSKGDTCMWIATDRGNICTACRFATMDIPCPTIQSVYGMKTVTDCQMRCGHQKITSKISPCTDTSGTISEAECMDKGRASFVKCMFTQYNEVVKVKSHKETTAAKSMCGPCGVPGVGKIPCSAPGMLGPTAGSSVSYCSSQCDMSVSKFGVPCGGPIGGQAPSSESPAMPLCAQTVPPPPPPLGVVPLTALKIKLAKGAPEYFSVPVPAPYGVEQYAEAARVAMHASGWPADSTIPPGAPVSIFGPPPPSGSTDDQGKPLPDAWTLPPQLPALFGPPPPGMAGVPPPGYGYGTPPPTLLQVAKNGAQREHKVLLRRRHA